MGYFIIYIILILLRNSESLFRIKPAKAILIRVIKHIVPWRWLTMKILMIFIHIFNTFSYFFIVMLNSQLLFWINISIISYVHNLMSSKSKLMRLFTNVIVIIIWWTIFSLRMKCSATISCVIIICICDIPSCIFLFRICTY